MDPRGAFWRHIGILLLALALFGPAGLRASAGGDAFNTSTGTLNVDYAGYMSKQDVVYGAPVTNPVEGLTVGQGRVGMMVWSQNGLTMQITGVDDSQQTSFSEGLINLVTSPGMDTNYTNFLERLSLFNGTLTTTYDTNRTVTIMGAPNSEVMGINVQDTRAGVTAVTLQLSIWSLAGLNNNGNVPNLTTWETVSTYANATSAGFSRGQADPNNFGYTLAATVDGTPFTTSVVNANTVQLSITPATNYTIWISCASRLNAPGNNSVTQAATELAAVTGTYTSTLTAYEAWWHTFWEKSFVEFSNSTGYADYIENLYYLATYMIASGSYGNYPFHFINGVFRYAGDTTKWSNAYWYWNQRDVYNGFLAANHPDVMNTFNNMYSRNLGALETQTQGRYNLSGIWVPETMGWNGNDSGTVGSTYTDNIYSSGTEAAENMYRQYLYTNSYAYLTSTAYPFMKQVCIFYSNILQLNANGKYYIPKTVDTNFGDNAHETYWNIQDAITDLAAIRSVFPDAISAAQTQGVDASYVTQWQNILNNLYPYPVDPGNSGQYYPCDPPLPASSNNENVTCELAWPYGRVGLDTSDLAFGISNWNNRPFPYGNVWSPDAIQAARLGLGDDAWAGMQTMMDIYQNYPNGMTNNTNGVFEYLGVNISALNESLMQSYDGTIHVFPAPTSDSTMINKFTLAAQGDFLISSENEAGELKYVGVNSLAGNTCTMANPWGVQQLDVRQVSDNAVILTTSAASFSFPTAANTVYIVEPTSKPFSSYSYEQITASQNEAAKFMAGNQLGTYTGSPPPPVDGLYTATRATLAGGTSLSGDSAATGAYEVVDFGTGASMAFSDVICGNELVIQYCTENNPGKLGLYINGVLNQVISFPTTNSWSGTYTLKTITGLTIPAGATLTLQCDTGDSGTNIAYVQVLGGCGTTPTYTSTLSATDTLTATHTATATVTATPTTTSTLTPTPTALPTCGNVIVYSVDCGSTTSYTDSSGVVWSPDEDFSGGSVPYTVASTITNTGDPALYQTNRYGNGAPLTYIFDVPDGTYLVKLLNSEDYFTAAGQRVFNIAIQGTPVLTGYDIYAASGGIDVATSLTFTATVTTGLLTIVGTATVNNPQFAGIQITWLGTPCPTSTLTVSRTITRSPTLTASPSASTTGTFTVSPTFSVTRTPTLTDSLTTTLSSTVTYSPMRSASPTLSYSGTVTSSASPTKTPSPDLTTTASATPSVSQTRTPSPSLTATASATISASQTKTPSLSPTATASVTISASQTKTPSPSLTATASATISASQTRSPSPSLTATFSATPSASSTITPSPSLTATSSATPGPSQTNTFSVTATPSFFATMTFSSTASPSATALPSRTATLTPVLSSSPSASATISVTPAITPSASATANLGSGQGSVLTAVPWPNPNPRQIAVDVDGTVPSLTLRIYTESLFMAAEVTTAPEGPGWIRIALPASFLSEAADGTYYYHVTAGDSSDKGVVGRLVVLR